MSRSFAHRHSSSPLHPRGLLAIVLGVLGAGACDRGPVDPLRAGTLRVSSIVTTDSAYGTGSRRDFVYDQAGRLLRLEQRPDTSHAEPVTSPESYQEYGYAGDRVISIRSFAKEDGAYVNYHTVRYSYDDAGRVEAQTTETPAWDGTRTTTAAFRYDAEGRVAEVQTAAGVATNVYHYEGLSRLLREELIYFQPNVPSRFIYTYTNLSNPFFDQPGHLASLLGPAPPWPVERTRNVLARREMRRHDDTLVRTVSYEYTYDDRGLPRQLWVRNREHSGSFGINRDFTLVSEYQYEPAGN